MAGARQILEQSPTWVSDNIAKQHLKADGGTRGKQHLSPDKEVIKSR